MESFLAALSLILSTNATIRASYQNMFRSSIAFSILPRLSYNSLTFQNFGFKNKFKLDHFQPILFRNCYFASNVDFNSHAPLYLENCQNITGTIISSAKIIYVSNSSFNQNFVGFDIQDCKNCSFINSNFSTKSSKRVISLKKSQSRFISCNFSHCLNGAIVSTDSNLTIINSLFQNLNSVKGAAIYFIGEKLFIDHCLFTQCLSTVEGGAIYFLARESTFQESRFIDNYSPKGKSIYCYYYQSSNPILNNCFFTEDYNSEFVKEKLGKDKNILRRILDFTFPLPPPTRSPLPTTTQSPTASASPSPSFSPRATPSVSQSPTASQSPSPSKSPVATATPYATPSFIERQVTDKKDYYITFVSVTCAVVVLVVIIIVVVFLVKKKKNKIYPKTDSDEAEPQGVSVIVNRIYSNSTKTIETEP